MNLEQRFEPQALIDAACEQVGADDFGADGWQHGLHRVTEALVTEARLSEIGVEVAYADMMRALKNRLGVIAWRNQNPRIAEEKISRPIFIVGQPRTGTTILYDLLAQDPALRTPLTWEVDEPCPVPRPETYETDPRIAQVQASIEMSEHIIPGFLKHHPMDARVGQECVRITASEFNSMIFSVQYRIPSYQRWWVHEADQAGAYAYHRVFLQHLQSGVPGDWLLKSPAHMWHLDALLAEYPDALIVQTHRDPLNVMSSVAALTHHLRRMSSDESSITDCAAQAYEEITVGLDREMAWRSSGLIPEEQVVDVRFADFMADPWATIKGIYERLDRDLTDEADARMRRFLAEHPGDGGAKRYTWSDTGLDAQQVRARVTGYQERYGVPTEELR
ncbi:MAG: sulfotransferase [Gordonia amarae]